jgi:uncharacterized phage protein (TIGR01671 family)
MMREIKFRAWDKELNFFCDPVMYFVGLDGSVWFNNCADGEDSMVDQSEKLIVEQCTGLKDKNSKEIYEGDILGLHGDPSLRFPVIWENEAAAWALETHKNEPEFLGDYNQEYIEIVGNIHEAEE